MTLATIRQLVADDAHALTFQTFGQYRTALLKAIDQASLNPAPVTTSDAERAAYPALPGAYATAHDDGHWTMPRGCEPNESRYAGWKEPVYSAAQMREYVDADRKERQLAACNFCLSEAAKAHAALRIDFKQATELLAMFGGEPGEVTLLTGEGHSGRGLYAHAAGHGEDGALFLGVADDEAVPSQVGKPAMDELRRACAKILREDPDRWPSHGDAPLAIRSVMSLLAMVVRTPSSQAKMSAAGLLVNGFDRETLSDLADGLDCYEKTVNVGAAIEPGMDVLLESTTAAAARFIRAFLVIPSSSPQSEEGSLFLGVADGDAVGGKSGGA